MGKLRTSYTNKPKHKPSMRPSSNGGGGGKPYIKRSNNRTEHDNDESEVVTGGKAYQKAVQSRDRYKEMAREALVSGDRVTAENYHQHADHYSRIINAAHEAEQEKLAMRRQRDDARESAAANESVSDAAHESIPEEVIHAAAAEPHMLDEQPTEAE